MQRLAPGAITRRFPAPNCSDAEVTKLALVEFAATICRGATHRSVAGAELRPWLVLVVGQRAAGDIVLRPDGRVTLGLVAQTQPRAQPVGAVGARAGGRRTEDRAHRRATTTRRWRGCQATSTTSPNTEYVACLVPAFTATGDDSWNGSAPVTCDLYDRWTFRTGPQGDFPELAAKLHKADLAAIELGGGKPFGRADVSYRSRTAPVKTTMLPTAGALRLPPSGGAPDPADAPPATDDRRRKSRR